MSNGPQEIVNGYCPSDCIHAPTALGSDAPCLSHRFLHVDLVEAALASGRGSRSRGSRACLGEPAWLLFCRGWQTVHLVIRRGRGGWLLWRLFYVVRVRTGGPGRCRRGVCVFFAFQFPQNRVDRHESTSQAPPQKPLSMDGTLCRIIVQKQSLSVRGPDATKGKAGPGKRALH